MKFVCDRLKSFGLLGLLITMPVLNNKNVLAQDISELRVVPNINDRSRICTADIPAAIDEIINRPELERSRWGIEIETEDGETIYSLNGNKFFTPASSAKLLTTAAVLSTLGADYRIVTPLLAVGDLPNLTSLRLQGRGDPSLSNKSLKQIVHQLQALGVKRIEKLIVDDSYFDSPAINPTWEWLDVHSYFATAVNSTILNQNTVTLTLLPQELGKSVKFNWSDRLAGRQWQVVNQGITGEIDIPYGIEIDGDLGKPILYIRGELGINEAPDIWDLAIVDPANYFLESLRLHLERSGISVAKGIVVKETSGNELETELLTLSSPSIAEIITEINRESNNLYAEVMAKILAKKLNTNNAIEAINQSLDRLGINEEEYILVDSSGLSRQNLVTPHALVKTLALVSRLPSPTSNIYRQSLAIAGINGTLRNRFKNTTIEGHLWAKTGTLTGVGTLSGYLYVPNYTPVIFSIIVNNSDLSSREIGKEIDRVVTVLNHIKRC
ncbi:D-alanyl-D-alanine carboxypeptidase/D-alanyl-D-alanine-endopeptidase [Waterburya agarophytonicola K14]|uniref:D-alanyl-D-alanine carboxypeptidase/D-alanyl-D-alanine-endopeptidase n=1 Tax=Waterburya agarophytonicola KI4 TaxID=2874699 RepID=A0A964BS87_9CYAN|nr:D-alanyl-D-alanine carboxypeptidase/D-alanyl-D-alanine-endopeptidase [Waterburya agarophytonicola]MCC0177862.1 D-alanyl-D-alanine carboxypeptidase/D-alanyl-D-alanine-endopeptidase [Waterburya agarophytonicola KI4]